MKLCIRLLLDLNLHPTTMVHHASNLVNGTFGVPKLMKFADFANFWTLITSRLWGGSGCALEGTISPPVTSCLPSFISVEADLGCFLGSQSFNFAGFVRLAAQLQARFSRPISDRLRCALAGMLSWAISFTLPKGISIRRF